MFVLLDLAAGHIHQYCFMREGISLTVPHIYNKTQFVKNFIDTF